METTDSKSSTSRPARVVFKTPNATDILFGRGGHANNNLGNRQYQKVIAKHSREYAQLQKRHAKTELSWQIFLDLRSQGIRFLKKEKGSRLYTEASEAEIRKKIGQRLRERAVDVKNSLVAEEEVPVKSDMSKETGGTEELGKDIQEDEMGDGSIFEPLKIFSADNVCSTSLMEAVRLLNVPRTLTVPTPAPSRSFSGTLIDSGLEPGVLALYDYEEEDYCNEVEELPIDSHDIFSF